MVSHTTCEVVAAPGFRAGTSRMWGTSLVMLPTLSVAPSAMDQELLETTTDAEAACWLPR